MGKRKGRQLIACQFDCQKVISVALGMTDEQWRQVLPIDRKLMIAAAQQSLANGRPILVLPFDAIAYRDACERLGIPTDGRLGENS